MRIAIHEPALSRDAGHGCHRIGAEVGGTFEAQLGFNQGESGEDRSEGHPGGGGMLPFRGRSLSFGKQLAFDLVPFWAVAEGWSKAIYFTSI
jgi:hypothetical protein